MIIELDGGIHTAAIYDHERQAQRDVWLNDQGFTVIRFRNSEVELQPHLVFQAIRERLPN